MKNTMLMLLAVFAASSIALANPPVSSAQHKPLPRVDTTAHPAISKIGPPPAGARFKPAIKKAYATNPKMKGATIRVDANANGMIYLWGKVRSAQQKTLAWRIAKHISLGRRVVNLLRVQAK